MAQICSYDRRDANLQRSTATTRSQGGAPISDHVELDTQNRTGRATSHFWCFPQGTMRNAVITTQYTVTCHNAGALRPTFLDDLGNNAKMNTFKHATRGTRPARNYRVPIDNLALTTLECDPPPCNMCIIK